MGVIFYLDQIEHAPIVDSGADHIDKELGKGEDPNEFIAQDIFKENFLGGKVLIFSCPPVFIWVVIPVFFNRGKAKRLGRVAQAIHDKKTRSNAEKTWRIERAPPPKML